MRNFLIVSILLFTSVCLSQPAPIDYEVLPNKQEVIQTIIDESVTVRTESGIGSGILFCKDKYIYVLTCNHVIKDQKKIYIHQEYFDNQNKTGERKLKAELVCGDEEKDLALLKVLRRGVTNRSWSEFDDDKPCVGDEIYHVGSFLGLTTSFRSGSIGYLDRKTKWGLKHQVNCGILPGSSGGGVFDLEGECIGIAQIVATTPSQTPLFPVAIPTSVGYVIPVSVIKEFAEENEVEDILFPENPC